jgi:uncharacterized protein with HEPN domain
VSRRYLLGHGYFDTSHSILQATVDYDIPALKDAILSLLQEPDKPESEDPSDDHE